MTSYIVARILATVPVLLGISLLVFAMLHLLPGDPIQAVLGETTGTSPAIIERIRAELGLDDPLHVQYAKFLTRAVRGDLGTSIRVGRPVRDMVLEQFPSTLSLAVAGLAIAVVVGLTFGVLAAYRRGTWIDSLSMVLALTGVSIPAFWLGLMLIIVFAVVLNLLPVTSDNTLRGLILPAATLGFGGAGIIARLTRSGMLEVLEQEYVTTARAKGLPELLVLRRHALKNALLPVVTIVGLQFGQLLGGAFIVEVVFARQGIGTMAVAAILAKDFPVVQGTVLLAAVSYVMVNLSVDLFYAVLDPRVRYR